LDKELQTRIELARLHLWYLEARLTGRDLPGGLLNQIEYEIYEAGGILERASNRLMDYLGRRCRNEN
jgi:hypothetical protein